MFKRGKIMAEKIGYIYILTNKSFHKTDLVKIGYTDNIEDRLKSLYNTSVPEPFEVYATYEVPFDSKMPDKAFHKLIQKLNPSLRVTENREFFEIAPWDAYSLLESMAIIHGRLDKLKRYNDNDYGSELEKDVVSYGIDDLFPHGSEEHSLFNEIESAVKHKFNHVQIKALKHYVAFKKDKKHNLIALWPKDGWVEVVLCAKLGTLNDPTDTVYDISNRLWSNAQYAIRYDSTTDINVLIDLISQIK